MLDPPPAPTESDQSRAEREAQLMATLDVRGHVDSCIGDFEGAGFSTDHRSVPTCEPSRDLKQTADATVCSPAGCYRVRSWRR